MSHKKMQSRLTVLALESRECPSSTVVLPISAFTSQQGTSMLYSPPLPDFIGWTNSVFDPGATTSDPFRFMSADYNGTTASYLLANGIDLHTQITGFVTETTLPGGLMEVCVNLEATNALAWVANVQGIDISQPGVAGTAPLEAGYRAQELVANPSLTPSLANIHFQITFQEQAGAPLPDLVQAFFLGNAPPGFAPEIIDFQAWGSGTLRAATTVGTPGQKAFFNTSQVGDFTNAIPGTLPDGFIQEAINIVPIGAGTTSIAYLNGSVFITDLGNGNDLITVTPTLGGGAKVSTSFGNGSFAAVNHVVVSLGNGNSNVFVGNLAGATVNVAARDGNNNIVVGIESETVVNVGAGNNHIAVGKANPAMVFVAGNGNNTIAAANGQNNIYLGGNGNNHIIANGTGDFIHLWGNGNNSIIDTGTYATVYLAGDGNNSVLNWKVGSFTHLLAGTGKNFFFGPYGP